MIRACPFSAILLLAAAVSSLGAGPDTHLFEARVPDGNTVVFLPAADVESPDDAAAWLRWAGESLPGGRKSLRAVWDEETVELELFGMAAAGLLHAGDDAVDPAGRVRFVLAETPQPGAVSVRVKLDSLPGAGAATPDAMCLTNVWILSRDTFFDHCQASVDAGRPLDARRTIAGLLDAGPVHPATPGYQGWREAIDLFCRANRGVEAAFRVRNGGEDPLRFRIGDGDVVDIAPGRTRDMRPDPDATAVDWTAWSEPVRADDDDYVPQKGRRSWVRFGDDVELTFDGRVGRLKDDPLLRLPEGAVPDGEEPEALVVYADDPGRAVPPKAVSHGGGRLAVSVEPRRAVSSVRLRADGWKNAEFRPAGGAPVAARRGEEAALDGSPMEKAVVPPPKEKAVPRNESEPRVVSESPKPSPPAAAVSAAPAPPWPPRPAVADAKTWLSGTDSAKPGLLVLAAGDEKDVRDRAVTYLRVLQGYWPVPGCENEYTRTFRAMVAHIAGCFDETCSFHIPDAADPKREALRLLGWPTEDQKTFCGNTIRDDGRFEWPWDKDMLRSMWIGRWKEDCRKALNRTDSEWLKARDQAFDRWQGINVKTKQRSDKEPFVQAYRHVETCSGCKLCFPFRDKVVGEPDFEARRAALFRGLVQAENPLSDRGIPLSDREVDAIVKEFARLEREQNGKGGNR